MNQIKNCLYESYLGLVALFTCAVIFTLKMMLKFDRHVLKKYCNIETPLYRFWWRGHAETMQKKIDKEFERREAYEFLGIPF